MPFDPLKIKLPFEMLLLFTTGAFAVDDCTTLIEPSLFNCQTRPGPGVAGTNVNVPEMLLAEKETLSGKARYLSRTIAIRIAPRDKRQRALKH